MHFGVMGAYSMHHPCTSLATRVAYACLQLVVLLVVLYTLYLAYSNYNYNIAKLGVKFGWSFIFEQSGFPIHQGFITHTHLHSNANVWLVGFINALSVGLMSMLLSTLLAIVIASFHYTQHPLLVLSANSYVEIFRNVPLLVQLLFWYNIWVQKMPYLQNSFSVGGILINNRGLFIADPSQTVLLLALFVLLLAALLFAYIYYQGLYGYCCLCALGLWLVYLCSGLLLLPGQSLPSISGFNIENALQIYPSFIGLCAGLTAYSAAFSAEIIRGAVQALPKGQSEVARSLGLSPWQIYTKVILVQILPAVIPNMASQYLNIAKNSSLGRSIGYPEVFAVFGGTVLNQTGRAVEIMLCIMATYFLLSFIIIEAFLWFDKRQMCWSSQSIY